MAYTLRKRPKSNTFDLMDDENAIGQLVNTEDEFVIYLAGDFERLLDPADSPGAALEAFEDWAASNTFTNLLIPKPTEN